MQEEQQALRSSGKKQNKFVKFLLKSWQPVPTWQSTIILFTIIGLALVIFGAVLMAINASIVEVSQRYDYNDACVNKLDCEITLKIDEKMESPVFVYYEIDNFYQNHRRYIKSKSADQLAGKIITYDQAKSDCDPLTTNKEMGFTDTTLSIDKKTALVLTEVAIPCGLIAKSFFTDTYELYLTGNKITINEKGIAWPSDLDNKFKNTDKPSLQWHDMEDEHFVVWMRTAGLPDFRKLWGRIEQDLAPGEYTVKIANNYDVDEFDGKKRFVLSTSGPFGGKNYFLAISYLVVGGVCLLIAMFFGIRWKHYSKKTQ